MGLCTGHHHINDSMDDVLGVGGRMEQELARVVQIERMEEVDCTGPQAGAAQYTCCAWDSIIHT